VFKPIPRFGPFFLNDTPCSRPRSSLFYSSRCCFFSLFYPFFFAALYTLDRYFPRMVTSFHFSLFFLFIPPYTWFFPLLPGLFSPPSRASFKEDCVCVKVRPTILLLFAGSFRWLLFFFSVWIGVFLFPPWSILSCTFFSLPHSLSLFSLQFFGVSDPSPVFLLS